ncbi:hypothetical protein LCGC14_0194620 [marine sediment metagenome]|uniref:Uncharacterized protein n=1 Tax=marine sediment metagenome TaxID=412755 RepID=A0A0F9UK50_9ZZZZ
MGFVQDNMIIIIAVSAVVLVFFIWAFLTGKFNKGISGLFDNLGDTARENIVKMLWWILGITIVALTALMGLGFLFSGGDDSFFLWDKLGLPGSGS